MKIAMFGGAFNPIHNAHLLIANELAEKYSISKVFFIPSKIPPHKHYIPEVTDKQRLKMISLAIKDNKRFKLSDIEINRGGVSYTIDTIKQLYKTYNASEKIYLFIGADLVPELSLWKDIDKLKDMVNFVVYNRNGETGKKEFNNYPYINLFQSIRFDVSSTLIRERLKNKQSISYLVPRKVEQYIYTNSLYC